jgi:hypothetical protein
MGSSVGEPAGTTSSEKSKKIENMSQYAGVEASKVSLKLQLIA